MKEYLEEVKGRVKEGAVRWEEVFNNEVVNYANVEWVHYAKRMQSQGV